MANLIDIIIRATWAGSQATQAAKKDLTGIDDGAKRGAAGLTNFAAKVTAAGIALGVTAAAAKKFYEALERGAGLQLTEQRFNRLAESIGTTGDALRDDLGEATGGLLSNAQQMALATDLLALGLANTHDQAVRLARGVAELDQDVGELSLALVNQTTRRFDQLGISAVGFEEKLKALEEQGLSTQEAFTEAFLQQMEAQIERVGGVADTSAGSLRRFEAGIQDAQDSLELALVALFEFAGGFEKLDRFTKVSLQGIPKFFELLTGGFEEVTRKVDDLNTAVQELFDKLGLDIGNEVIDKVDGLDSALQGLAAVLGLTEDNAENLGYAIQGAADVLGIFDGFTRSATDGQEELAVAIGETTNAVNKLNAAYQEMRGNQGRGEGGGLRSAGTPPTETFGTIQERVTLFQDFQDDLAAITTEGAAERAAIEEQYESQRTAIVENYGRLRAQEEADWQLRRARQEEDFQRSLQEVQENAAESERAARDDINQRLEDLHEGHLKRLQDIIDSANTQLLEAGSELDAKSVAKILRQRDAALKKENESYTDQRQEIEQQLQQQLEAIRDNMQERLVDMQEFHDLQQEREEEDRAIRLQRLEEAHRQELAELEDQYQQRMQDLKDQIRREKAETTAAYNDAYNKLILHHDYLETLTANYHERILQAEQDWWAAREALIGGDSGRGDTGTGGTGGTTGPGGDGGGGDGGIPPGRPELNQIAIREMQLANWTESMIFSQLQQMHPWSDAQVARWIEDTFGFDVPGYAMGTPFVPQTGLALVHRGEEINPPGSRSYDSPRQANVTLNVYPSPGMDEAAFARLARREFEQAIREMV